jgi:NADH dehydrogenase
MILVTGGSGYLGHHIVGRLAAEGEMVRVLVRNREHAEREARLEGLDIEWATGDVTEPASLKAAMDGIQQVIHTVAIAIEKGQGTYETVNYQGTVNTVSAAEAAGVYRFINISQLGASPDVPYRFLASKGAAQAHVAQSSLPWTAFRPSVIWGPQDEFANTFARLAPLSPIIFPIVGDDSATFQPVWVEDVASAVAQSLSDSETVGEEYELGGPEILTLEEIERRTLTAIGANRLMIRFPLPLLRLVVRLMGALMSNPPVTSSLLELLQVSNVPENDQMQRFVDSPRPFTAENIAPYMSQFRVANTLQEFWGG